MRVLIVEDDPGIVSFLEKGLRAEGYATAVADSTQGTVVALWNQDDDFDVVLLDLSLREGSGEEVLEMIRLRDARTPIIVLTARDKIAEKVRLLNLGANDYVTKPFSFEELLARVRAAVRASDQTSPTELVVGDLRFDALTKVAWRAGRRIDLRRREWALLELFMRNPSNVLSRAQILSQVWDMAFDPGSNVVDVYISYLRKKVNPPGLTPLIQTVRGAGYRLLPAPVAADHS